MQREVQFEIAVYKIEGSGEWWGVVEILGGPMLRMEETAGHDSTHGKTKMAKDCAHGKRVNRAMYAGRSMPPNWKKRKERRGGTEEWHKQILLVNAVRCHNEVKGAAEGFKISLGAPLQRTGFIGAWNRVFQVQNEVCPGQCQHLLAVVGRHGMRSTERGHHG